MPNFVYANRLAITSNLQTGEFLLRFMQETAVIDFTDGKAGPFEREDVASVVITTKTAQDLASIINNMLFNQNTAPQVVRLEPGKE